MLMHAAVHEGSANTVNESALKGDYEDKKPLTHREQCARPRRSAILK